MFASWYANACWEFLLENERKLSDRDPKRQLVWDLTSVSMRFTLLSMTITIHRKLISSRGVYSRKHKSYKTWYSIQEQSLLIVKFVACCTKALNRRITQKTEGIAEADSEREREREIECEETERRINGSQQGNWDLNLPSGASDLIEDEIYIQRHSTSLTRPTDQSSETFIWLRHDTSCDWTLLSFHWCSD